LTWRCSMGGTVEASNDSGKPDDSAVVPSLCHDTTCGKCIFVLTQINLPFILIPAL